MKHTQMEIFKDLEKKVNDILKFKAFFKSKSKQYMVPIETLMYCLRGTLFVPETPTTTHIYQVVRHELMESCINTSSAYNILASTLSLSKSHILSLRMLFKVMLLQTFSFCGYATHDDKLLMNIRDFLSLFHPKSFHRFSAMEIYPHILQFWGELALSISYATSRCLGQLLAEEGTGILQEVAQSLLHILELFIASEDRMDVRWKPIALLLGTPNLLQRDVVLDFVQHLIVHRPTLIAEAISQSAAAVSTESSSMMSSVDEEGSVVLRMTQPRSPQQTNDARVSSSLARRIISTLATYYLQYSSMDSAPHVLQILRNNSAIFTDIFLEMPIFALHLTGEYLRDVEALKELCFRSQHPGEIDEIERVYNSQTGLQRMSLCTHYLALKMIRNELMDSNFLSAIVNRDESAPIIALVTWKEFILGGMNDTSSGTGPLPLEFYELLATLLMIYTTYSEPSVILNPSFPSMANYHSTVSTTLLNSLAFSRPFDPVSRMFWWQIKSLGETEISAALNNDIKNSRDLLASRLPRFSRVLSLLYLFCLTFNHQLSAVDDEELLEADTTMLYSELPEIIRMLKFVLQTLYGPESNGWCPDTDLFAQQSKFGILHLQITATRLFNNLYIRNE